MNFNKEQLELINHKEGACVVFAGAGSGKSASLVNRVKKLIDDGVSSDEILVTTFSNKSGQDLKKKLSELNIKDVTVGTFHSICGRILNDRGIDTSNKIKSYEIDNLFNRLQKGIKPKEVKEIMGLIGFQKNNIIGINDDYEMRNSQLTEDYVRTFYNEYEKYKTKRKSYDWDDVLLLAYEELKKENLFDTYEYVMVDEAQDNCPIQNEIIKLLCPSGNIMLIGDTRQSIYGFRGSKPELMLNLKNEFPETKVINLYYNYRSTNNIVNCANGFIKPYCDTRYYVPSKAFNESDGNINIIDNFSLEQEAEVVADLIKDSLESGTNPNDICVLYRNNQNSFELERELRLRNIDYFVNSETGSFFDKHEIQGIMSILRLIQNPNDDSAFSDVLDKRFYPLTYLPNTIKGDIVDLSARRNISMFDASDLIQTDKPYQKKSLINFRENIESLIVQNNNGVGLKDIINNIIKLFKIEDYINNRYDEEIIDERLASLVSIKSFVKNNTLDSFINFVYNSNKSKKKCGINDIQLMTCHKSKGLEFKEVYLIGVENGKFPSIKAFDVKEEARLFYVAVTRAKENLTISQIGDKNEFVQQYKEFLK